ncbi:hypothetical protein [Streptomyces sp. NPDC002845]
MSEHQEHEVVVAVWAEHSDIGHHYEELLADGRVIAWTQPPFGETVHPGEDGPDRHRRLGVCHRSNCRGRCLDARTLSSGLAEPGAG